MKHIISVEVENRFGVLARITSLFSARGFNIDSLAVGETEDPTISRITMVVPGDDQIIEQVIKQLRKLIDVISLAEIFRAHIVDVHPESFTLEVTGTEDKIQALLTLLKPFGIKKLVRTGKVALAREPKG